MSQTLGSKTMQIRFLNCSECRQCVDHEMTRVTRPLLEDSSIDPSVELAIAPKCDRCWRHVPDVGNNANYPTVCLRCAEALDAIDFPPYARQSTDC